MDDFKVIILMVLGLLIIGVPIGFILRRFARFKDTANRIVGISVYIMLLLLGAGLGSNHDLMGQLAKMSHAAVIITLGAFMGSIFVSAVIHKIFFTHKANKNG